MKLAQVVGVFPSSATDDDAEGILFSKLELFQIIVALIFSFSSQNKHWKLSQNKHGKLYFCVILKYKVERLKSYFFNFQKTILGKMDPGMDYLDVEALSWQQAAVE